MSRTAADVKLCHVLVHAAGRVIGQVIDVDTRLAQPCV